jgi:hypothetical protein
MEVRVGDPTLKSLLIAICHRVNHETFINRGVWECFPSLDALAYDTEVSKRTIQRRLEELEELEFIRIDKRRKLDGTQDTSLITVSGGQIVTLVPPVDKNRPTGGQKPGAPVDTAVHHNKQEEQEEKEVVAPKKSKNGTRIPDDWQLTPDLGNYGRSKGLTRNEVLAEAEKFVNYWRSVAGAKARKVDWDLTWKGWIQRTAERLGRKPMAAAPEPEPSAEFDRETWQNLSKIYENSNNWSRQWGPEPGRPGCRMPVDLQSKFVNHGLTAH